MANLHTATVFIWRNSHDNDIAADAGKKLSGDSSKTGHAAMKLQTVGAVKGDYYYLSFWPGKHPIHGSKFHSMTGRMGPRSLGVANESLKGDWGSWQEDQSHQFATKRFATSLDFAGDFERPFEGLPGLGGDDTAAMGRKPDVKHRMNGLALDRMIAYVKRIADYAGDAPTGLVFNIATFNCATAVATCLREGGAEDMPVREVWSPNRLSEWCETLVRRYDGQTVVRGRD